MQEASDAPPLLRDIGGVPLADGRMIGFGRAFRISAQIVTVEQLEALRQAGVRVIVDLRGSAEDRTAMHSWARRCGIDYRSEPIPAATRKRLGAALADGATPEVVDRTMRDLYLWIVDNHGAEVAGTLSVIAGGLTTGFGCAAGRDRTGIVTALLQSLLGASDEAVAEAYLSAAPAPALLRPQLRAIFGVAADAPLSAGAEVLLSPREEWILNTLAHVRAQHGSVRSYLAAHGLSDPAVARLAERLVVAEVNDRSRLC